MFRKTLRPLKVDNKSISVFNIIRDVYGTDLVLGNHCPGLPENN